MAPIWNHPTQAHQADRRVARKTRMRPRARRPRPLNWPRRSDRGQAAGSDDSSIGSRPSTTRKRRELIPNTAGFWSRRTGLGSRKTVAIIYTLLAQKREKQVHSSPDNRGDSYLARCGTAGVRPNTARHGESDRRRGAITRSRCRRWWTCRDRPGPRAGLREPVDCGHQSEIQALRIFESDWRSRRTRHWRRLFSQPGTSTSKAGWSDCDKNHEAALPLLVWIMLDGDCRIMMGSAHAILISQDAEIDRTRMQAGEKYSEQSPRLRVRCKRSVQQHVAAISRRC